MNWKYQPSAYDIQWTRCLTEKIRDGGVWGIPREQTVYQFDKTHKKLRLIYGSPGMDFAALKAICPLIGWELVIELVEPKTMPPSEWQAILVESGMGKTLGGTYDIHSRIPKR